MACDHVTLWLMMILIILIISKTPPPVGGVRGVPESPLRRSLFPANPADLKQEKRRIDEDAMSDTLSVALPDVRYCAEDRCFPNYSTPYGVPRLAFPTYCTLPLTQCLLEPWRPRIVTATLQAFLVYLLRCSADKGAAGTYDLSVPVPADFIVNRRLSPSFILAGAPMDCPSVTTPRHHSTGPFGLDF